MTRPWRFPLSLCAALSVLPGALVAAGGLAADSTNTITPGRLVIQSVPESALVVIDGKPAGSTPLTIDPASPGIHVVILQHPDRESWLTDPVSDTVHIANGEQRVLRYSLRSRRLITSSPFGAEVILGDSVVGTTPFVAGPGLDGQSLTLRKSGYAPVTTQLSGSQQAIIDVPLNKVWPNDGNGESVVGDTDGKGAGSTGLYLSGAATVVSGVAAAYFKIKADDRYQQYLDTNEGRILDQTHRLDTAAGLAIAATQLGLGLFTYFIISR